MKAVRSFLAGNAALCFHGLRRLAGQPQRYILVLSHMRSGSTLLHHLLQTNRSIIGAGESNRVYRSAADLRRLSLWVHLQRSALLSWRACVTDQINHTAKLADVSLLQRADVRTIFLIREPLAAIASIIRLTHDFYRTGWSSDKAVEYYLLRLETLRACAFMLNASRGPAAFFLTYDDLVSNPVASLAALQGHLHLREPFSVTYRSFDFTGLRGDPSGRIRSNRILTPEPANGDVLQMKHRYLVEDRYREVVRSLQADCITPGRVAAGS